ncbi:MarR family winged helix-turn-helix transcriptional regulator [Crossiella cryophila]|uniref:DNA-binding MarR family transcriptional regulator n=1 Tax=Crossiella cryophila TaxID=43355 RepID=A0A7W7CN15_9PSEU|nr:MarR family transcriptional regulator [Crossiella cryophila]MBB4682444.1 DNA-binding MarR family transcriptional regulator [Crossiella cryophila]
MTGRRRDLAAMIGPLVRGLVAAELPVLRAHGVSMWAYSVLTALDEGPVRTQAALAQAIGADKTRIIGVLDGLQQQGLIERRADPADRRVRLVSITERGTALRRAAQAEIQAKEERVLARLPSAERAAFLAALETLSAVPPEEIAGA